MKAALFPGYGTSIHDYSKLINLLEEHYIIIETYNSNSNYDMIICHSHGSAQVINKINENEITNALNYYSLVLVHLYLS